ncbi:MAG TPA: hypothetical protein VEJ36_06590 [Nitrososphaerales archaeon]|nr:hypothetical protein [Nitrososphaerales archaeon]
MQEFSLYKTEAGTILLEGGLPIASSKDSPTPLIEKAKKEGVRKLTVSDAETGEAVRAAGLDFAVMSAFQKEEFDTRKIAMMVESKLAGNLAEATELLRQKSIEAAEETIREESSRPDLHVVQAIQALDDADKFLNVVATRTAEWYGLHFPELTQMMQDNMVLCRMISEIGGRQEFTKEKLQGRGLTEKKIEAVLTARDRSKGGEVSKSDLARVRELAALALELSSERDRLAGYVETSMKQVAPNVAVVAGATIGARLMAKAGGLDRLATMPASTIQILGAEKALFRSLKTGARPPKHGILFQHLEVHTAPKWQRGKIARTLANKIAIAARVDCYRGAEDPKLKPELEKRLEQIRTKYKDPPKKQEKKRRS